jgi:hypothetical protein
MSTNPDNRDNQSLITQTRSDICRYYFIPCIVLILLCAGVFVFVGVMSIGDTRLSIGLGILILLGVVLAVLAIIAMVASYREMSRLHNGEQKEFLYKADDILDRLQKLGITDTDEAKQIGETLSRILSEWDTLGEEMKQNGKVGAQEALAEITTKIKKLEKQQDNVTAEVKKATQTKDALDHISEQVDKLVNQQYLKLNDDNAGTSADTTKEIETD